MMAAFSKHHKKPEPTNWAKNSARSVIASWMLWTLKILISYPYPCPWGTNIYSIREGIQSPDKNTEYKHKNEMCSCGSLNNANLLDSKLYFPVSPWRVEEMNFLWRFLEFNDFNMRPTRWNEDSSFFAFVISLKKSTTNTKKCEYLLSIQLSTKHYIGTE